MNILIIFPHGNAFGRNTGAETRVSTLVSSLTKNNFKVSILHSEKFKDQEDTHLRKKCNVFYFREFNIFGMPDWYLLDFNPYFIIKLYQIINCIEFDIIQIEFPWGFLITKFLAKHKTFLIYDSHGIECKFIDISILNPRFPRFFKPFAKYIVKAYEICVSKLSNLIIFVSRTDKNYYLKNFKISENRLITLQIPSSINNIEFSNRDSLKEKSRAKLGLPKEKTIIIFHGSLPHPPNQEAFSIIENRISKKFLNKNVLFVLAGINVKKYTRGNIISLGFVENLKDLMYSADFAILPILSGEGQRVKCSDYIATAVPFIGTKKSIQGIEFLENGVDCLLYETVDSEFIKGIMTLHQNKFLQEKFRDNLSKKAYKLQQNEFDIRVKKIYSSIEKNIKISSSRA